MTVQARPWAELVFHVLAHLEAGSHLAPSLHDARYIAQCAARLGPASGRPLGEDLLALAALLTSHDAMVEAQSLAWLFDSVAQASAAAARPLAALSPDDVAQPALLAALRGDAAELLFCAALLEREAWQELPAATDDGASIQRAVSDLRAVAPGLDGVTLAALRPLGLRGRVCGGEVWVGVPGWGEATPERCAWQAAHEATVREVCLRCPEVSDSHAAREELAVALLARRSRAAGRHEAHARWAASFAPVAPVLGERLEPSLEALLRG